MVQVVRLGVVDDQPASRELVVEHLERYGREHDDVTFEVRTYTDGAELVERYRSDLDLLLLDVQMPQMDGLEAARRVRVLDADVVIVFLTNMAQYAVKGYEVDALGYLVKPVPYFAFAAELKRAVDRVRRTRGESLVLPVPGGVARVAVADILYVESIKHRIVVHSYQGDHALTGTLKAFEEALDGKGFFRSNSGYLVNLRHVTAVGPSSCTLAGRDELQVSRPRRKAFLAALTDHVGGRPV
ncbi:MAG: LytTR family DNA-binding domain-containing protein [Cellulomonas sp.]|nr:LytTR family DNA-binding domain-containing protein [Cellulomonas sp.]